MTDFELAENAFRLARDQLGGNATPAEVVEAAKLILEFLKANVTTQPSAGA